jgi:hypothetical protein
MGERGDKAERLGEKGDKASKFFMRGRSSGASENHVRMMIAIRRPRARRTHRYDPPDVFRIIFHVENIFTIFWKPNDSHFRND